MRSFVRFPSGMREIAIRMSGKGDPAETRRTNRRLILDILRREGPRSRVELRHATGLSGAAVTMLITDLMDDGLVFEGDQQKSSGGRRPVSIQIDYASRYSIGVKVMSHSVEAVLTDLSTASLKSVELKIPDPSPDIVASVCRDLVELLLPDASDRGKLVGIGLGLPGLIDRDHGVCVKSHRFGWTEVPIARLVEAATGLSVWIDNDVNAYAVAQQLFGYGRAHDSMAVFILGTGVGAAVIANGQVVSGTGYAAGEIGFCRDPGEPRSAPTWDQRFSEPSLVARWRASGQTLDLETAAAANDKKAIDLLSHVGKEVGERLANLVAFLDPALVIVSGEALRFGPHLTDVLRNAFEDSYPFSARPELVIDWHPDYWARGAAALAVQSFFSRN